MPESLDLSAKKWNDIVEQMVSAYREQRDAFIEQLMVDGHPPFTEPVNDEEKFRTLTQLREAGHPAFWQSPEAQAELDRLSEQFGTPGPLQPAPITGDVPTTLPPV